MTWTIGLQIVTMALILLVPFGANKKQPSLATILGLVFYTICYFVMNLFQLALIYLESPQAYGLALRLYPLSLFILAVMFLATIFWLLTRREPLVVDLQARLIWLVFLTAKCVAAIEYVQCKLFKDPFGSSDLLLSQIWGIEVSHFACGRLFGFAAPFVVPIVTALTLIWINWRASQIKE